MATHSSILTWKILWTECVKEWDATEQLACTCTHTRACTHTRVRTHTQFVCANPKLIIIPPHYSILAWKILWTEEPGGLLSMGLQSWT